MEVSDTYKLGTAIYDAVVHRCHESNGNFSSLIVVTEPLNSKGDEKTSGTKRRRFSVLNFDLSTGKLSHKKLASVNFPRRCVDKLLIDRAELNRCIEERTQFEPSIGCNDRFPELFIVAASARLFGSCKALIALYPFTDINHFLF